MLLFESAAFAALLYCLLLFFVELPQISGPVLAPYTDLMLSTWWFFLPKSAEILVQQLLIIVLVLTLHEYTQNIVRTMVAYALTFGGLHVIIYLFVSAPAPYETVMTLAAIVSTVIFPYFILRVRGGFIHTYALHLLFYIALGMIMHAWPPPEYVQVFVQ